MGKALHIVQKNRILLLVFPENLSFGSDTELCSQLSQM